jgi:hypothetical protein
MSLRRALSRRTVLRGLGAAVALPWLEAMGALGGAAPRTAAADGNPDAVPLRLLWFFAPNGICMSDWTPRQEGADFAMPWILEPLAPHRDRLLVLSGLAQDQARAHGDGPGDHARSTSVFLTGAHPLKTPGANLRVGISADQVAARALGGATRFASLELGLEDGRANGACDSGYSCAYSNSVSWRAPGTPSSKETRPRLVFDRLFRRGKPGESPAQRARRRRRRASILDLVGEDARRLRRGLGRADRGKLDEYLAGVREIERRIERDEAEAAAPGGGDGPRAGAEPPAGIPRTHREHFRRMLDLLVLALQTDSTRVATFMVGNGASGASYAEIGVPESHHGLSHHGNDPVKLAKLRRINRFHVEQLAYLLERLSAVRTSAGNLLDACMIVYGSGIGDGNRHNHDELPVLLLGGGGGRLQPGRHVRHPRWTPLNDLHLALLQRAGVPVRSLGDSRAPLAGL